jgi:hypothetical protein
MKSKDVQKAKKTKYKNSDGPTKIHRDLVGVVSLWVLIIYDHITNTQL